MEWKKKLYLKKILDYLKIKTRIFFYIILNMPNKLLKNKFSGDI